ncbi:MAG TPA: YggS family pyridoxal phosphate-dependent enzyme [bacterium]|nr:YggS family pyridoxal phosphate-dependent enzyme [bacterium]
MTDLTANFRRVRARIAAACADAGRAAEEVALLAVSKHHPAAAVRAAISAGQWEFGENRVQELVTKAGELACERGLRWHLIGSLQTNKVKDAVRVPGLTMVQSVDRSRLVDALQRELAKVGRDLDVLLQVNASGEPQKHGVAIGDAAALLDHIQTVAPALRVQGLMAMGPLVGDPRPTFDRVVELRRALQDDSGLPLSMLSLGMSGDLEAAIAAGSTMVRVGTALFGKESVQE